MFVNNYPPRILASYSYSFVNSISESFSRVMQIFDRDVFARDRSVINQYCLEHKVSNPRDFDGCHSSVHNQSRAIPIHPCTPHHLTYVKL